MKVDGSLKNLIQGVSQQPQRTRLAGQCTLQENMTSNPVDGLSKRPPLKWVDDLFSTEDDVQFHHLKQGQNNFIACATTDAMRVFDLDGTEKTVTEASNGFDYLDGGKLAFTTLENQTFVANTGVTCEMETELPSFTDYGVIVYIRGGNYYTTYNLTIDWKDPGASGTARTITVSYTTDNTNRATIETVYIAEELRYALANLTTNGFNTTFTVTRIQDVLYITWADTSRTDTFTAVVGDTAGNNNAIACNNSVKQVSELPRFAPHGYFVTVTGDGSQDADDYYLEFSVTPDDQGNTPALGSGFGKAGVWIETVKNDIEYLINWDTMPHVLEYDEDLDEFTFGPGEWGDRLVGDEDSNPTPSFIKRTINDLGYFQGRLVMLAGPAVVMSRTNESLDFWAVTGTTGSNEDPIDVQSTAKGVTEMLSVIPHNRDLVIFADNAQFIIFGRTALRWDNASLVLTTAFEANLDAKPVPAGRNIFFAINYGNYTGVREFFTEGSVDINDSRPITQHVLKYITGGVRHMASTSNFDTLLVSAGTKTDLYVYEYIWVNDTKAQSSWSKWILPEAVEYFFFVESIIYVVSKSGTNYYLEQIDLDAQFDEDLTYQVKLDHKVELASINTTTTNPIPYVTDIDDMVFIQGSGCPYPGMRLMVDEYDSNTGKVTFISDMGGGTVIAGTPYICKYRPTMPMVKDEKGVKIGTGRLIIRKFLVNLRKSGGMNAMIDSYYRDPATFRYSGRIVGDNTSLIGQPAIVDQTFEVPFRDNADNGEIEIYDNGHAPLTIMDIEWLGQYTKRGRRITQGD